MSAGDKTLIILACLLATLMLIYAADKAYELYTEYNEWSTERRRAKYRRQAYKELRERETIAHNRATLWEMMKR